MALLQRFWPRVMSDPITAVALLIAGGMLGYLSSLGLARAQHRQALTLRIADEYFVARRELVDLVSTLADIKLLDDACQEHWLQQADAVGNLFYRQFDLLPREVLDRLMLLHVALRNPQSGPFALDAKEVVPMASRDLIEFTQRCSIFENSMYIAPLALNSENPVVRGNQVVKLHARDVLYALAECGSVDQLTWLATRVRNADGLR
jgi:hypothetical protein